MVISYHPVMIPYTPAIGDHFPAMDILDAWAPQIARQLSAV